MLWIHIGIIRESRDQFAFDQFPGLIAVFHALHRLLAPRHPPHALSSLAALIDPLALLQEPKRDHAVTATVRSRHKIGIASNGLILAILRRTQRMTLTQLNCQC